MPGGERLCTLVSLCGGVSGLDGLSDPAIMSAISCKSINFDAKVQHSIALAHTASASCIHRMNEFRKRAATSHLKEGKCNAGVPIAIFLHFQKALPHKPARPSIQYLL